MCATSYIQVMGREKVAKKIRYMICSDGSGFLIESPAWSRAAPNAVPDIALILYRAQWEV